MMLIVTSPHTIVDGNGNPKPKVVKALRGLTDIAAVGVISTHAEPDWFDGAFKGSAVEFAQWGRRQGGEGLRVLAEKYKVPQHLVLVLAATRDDVAMAKNGNAVMAGAGWAVDETVAQYGLKVEKPKELDRIMRVVAGWSGERWYRAEGKNYSVEAVCNISTYWKSEAQQQFGLAVKSAVKSGDAGINELLAVSTCVLLSGGVGRLKPLMWGGYPSSSSQNNDTEVLSEFVHRLRTGISNVQFAKREVPLFWRHKQTQKRSAGNSANRENPASEVESIHVNPWYRGKVSGKNVVVVDDCTTYGVSMAVAAGFLRRAGAKSVTCLALGKFGSKLGCYDVRIKPEASPFAPVKRGDWECSPDSWTSEQEFTGAQEQLRALLLGE